MRDDSRENIDSKCHFSPPSFKVYAATAAANTISRHAHDVARNAISIPHRSAELPELRFGLSWRAVLTSKTVTIRYYFIAMPRAPGADSLVAASPLYY